MNKKIFKKHMTQGLGRCILELKGFSVIEQYRDTVLWGCLNNIAYDAQCEGTRAEYMFRLAMHFDNPDYFVIPVTDAFANLSSRKEWDFLHLCELLSLFADSGSTLAKKALWNKYDVLFSRLLSKKQRSNYDCDCFEQLSIQLINIGDELCLSKIISDITTLLKTNNHYRITDFEWFFVVSKKKFGTKQLKSIPGLDFLKSRKQLTPQAAPPSFEDVLKELNETGNISIRSGVHFIRRACETEQSKLISYALEEPDIKKKTSLLRLFKGNENISHHQALINYAKSDFKELSEVAFNILTNCKSSAAHDFAHEILASGKHTTEAVCILIRNYTSKDKPLLLSALNSFKFSPNGNSDWHYVTMDLLDAFEEKIPLTKEVLFFIYENTFCSCCRMRAVRQLSKHRWLTKNIIEECRHDSNEDIVMYINRYYSI